MFTICKISFFLPRSCFQSVFIKWKNKCQTEGSVEKNLLHSSATTGCSSNRHWFYILLVSSYSTKGARHIFSPNRLWEPGRCTPWTSKVMLYLKKKKKGQTNPGFIFFCLIFLVLFLTEDEMIAFIWSRACLYCVMVLGHHVHINS